MSEVAEDMQALDAFKRNEKAEREKENLSTLIEAGIVFTSHQKGVVRVQAADALVIYYPSTDKWQYRGRVIKGDANSFVVWLKSRLPE